MVGNNRWPSVIARSGLLFFVMASFSLIALLLLGEDTQGLHAVLGTSLSGMLFISILLSAALPLQWSKSLGIHGVLILGAILFMFPFVWLVTTSFKYPEEVVSYPPKWIPTAPVAHTRSPYVSAELFPRVEPPPSMSSDAWENLRNLLEKAAWNRAQRLLGADLLHGLPEDCVIPALFQALWHGLAPGLPPDLWQKDCASLLAELESRMTPERLEDAWNGIYRCTALRDFFVTDLEQRDYSVVSAEGFSLPHAVVETKNLRPRRLPLHQDSDADMLQLTYFFEDAEDACITLDFALPIPEASLLSITLPIRMDRSWHRLGFFLEMGGKRYESHNPLFLNRYRWQELTFKLADRDAADERDLGVWPLYASGKPVLSPIQPGHIRVTLSIHRSSRIGALVNKYVQNYRDAWFAGKYWPQYISNSIYLVAITIIGQLISCSMAAYAFARLRWPGRELVFMVLLGSMMLPGQVSMIPVFLIFRTLGWYNTLKPLWIPSFMGSAFFIFLLRQFMKGIPRELEEAALIDGCGYFGIYRRIILPLVKPALAAVAIFTFMGTWNDFMGPLIYISDQRLYPLALGLFEFRAARAADFGLLMAASTLMILPVIALFFLAQRYFIQGVTLTGLKN